MVTLKTVLLGLRLRNIALIESLEIGFDKGFSVFTGETGAGKSIFLDAIDALLGGFDSSSSSRLLRTGTDSGLIEAYFSITASLTKWLCANSFDIEEEEIILTREFKQKEERLITRYRLNGQIINRKQILEIRPLLIDLTIQGQAYKFSSSTKQLFWLDTFGSSLIKNKHKDVLKAWNNWRSILIKLENFQKYYEEYQTNFNSEQLFLDDLEKADLQDPLEDITLLQDQDRLVHSVTLQETLSKIFFYLKENSIDSPTALENISLCIHDLKGIISLDQSLSIKLEKAIDIQAIIQDFVSELELYSSSLESDPEQLSFIQERIAVLKKLKLRYGMNLPDLISKRDSLLLKNNSEDLKSNLINLHDAEKVSRLYRDKQNSELTKLRKTKAEEFELLLKRYLQPLGLANVRFKVLINDKEPSSTGKDHVQFMFSANPGQPLSPLSQIASGGEMSRFLLAIKRILSQLDNSSVLVFDEIDAGVSGRVSSAISSVLKEISQHRQVFCVTHQPLIAAIADHHFSVSKSIHNGQTQSKVEKLTDFDQRKRELAELAGGDFEEANLYAASLLEKKAA